MESEQLLVENVEENVEEKVVETVVEAVVEKVEEKVEAVLEAVLEPVVEKVEAVLEPVEEKVEAVLEAVEEKVSEIDSLDILTKELLIQTADMMVQESLNLESSANLVPVLRIVMEAIEEKEMTGPDQSKLAQMVLRNTIDNSVMTDENKRLSLEILENGLLENTMMLISDASKGKLKINKKKVKTSILKGLMGCLKSFNKKKEDKIENKI